MDNASMNGSQTNHEREKNPKGVSNGNRQGGDNSAGRSEPQAASIQRMTLTGNTDNSLYHDGTVDRLSGVEEVPRDINQLPPELLHVSAGYLSFSTLLRRMCERSHNEIERAIVELARMPMPMSAINGNAAHLPSGNDDSQENVEKKVKLLKVARDLHSRWVKALMLHKWARKAETVSKVIDLRVHLLNQTRRYHNSFEALANTKRDLGFMRVRNPDLKTAAEVLSTGNCSWMPDLGYIEPPPLTAREILQTLKNLNTLLSIRINLHEYEKLPFYFRSYSIKSGRVTFRVPGEFELDLTIADENPEAQFYFIDFRLLFAPRLSHIPEALLFHLENRVNFILAQDDPFTNCYKFLHEVVLTHKIAEIKKQAYHLNAGKWFGTLEIEPLQRALCIQYWHGRHTVVKGPKSWIIIGVYSGKRKDRKVDAKATPRIGLRWFRDAKEVKDVIIPLDLDHISTESLLKSVIAMHVDYILTSTYAQLSDVPLYKDRDMAIELSISPTEPIESILKLQVTYRDTISVVIEPITGAISLGPASAAYLNYEAHLNRKMVDPAKDMAGLLMELRPTLVAQDLMRKCISTGWENAGNPGLKMDDIRSVFRKQTQKAYWLRKPEWRSQWYVVVGTSPRGEEWRLVEISILNHAPPGPVRGKALREVSTVKISRSCLLPMTAVSPIPSYEFFATLQVYAAAQISHKMDVGLLHTSGIKYVLQEHTASVNGTLTKIPRILIPLIPIQGLLPHRNKGSPWAQDMVKLSFSGVETNRKRIEPHPPSALDLAAATSVPAALAPSPLPGPLFQDSVTIINHATIIVPSCKDLKLLGNQIDRDIYFQASTGAFTIKICTPFGQSCIPALQTRICDIERLVDHVKVMDSQKSRYLCESVSLKKIVFTYKSSTFVGNEKGCLISADGADLQEVPYRATVNLPSSTDSQETLCFESGNPHIRLEDRFNDTLRHRGLSAMLGQLTFTLALLTAFDTIEQSWAELGQKGTVSCNIRAPQASHVVYRLKSQPKSLSNLVKAPKVVRLEVSYRKRGQLGQWCVKRIHDGSDSDYHAPDEVDDRLQDIWCTIGKDPNKPWTPLNTCAASKVPAVGALLLAIDSIIKTYVNQIDAPKGPATADTEAKKVAPTLKNEETRNCGPFLNSFDGSPEHQRRPALYFPQQSRNVAPQAPMMVPRANMMVPGPNNQGPTQAQLLVQRQAHIRQQQHLASLPSEAQQRAYRERMMDNQRAQAELAARQAQRDREVITLDD